MTNLLIRVIGAAAMVAAAFVVASCGASKKNVSVATEQTPDATWERPAIGGAPASLAGGVGPALAPGYRFIPRARAYQTSGNFRDNVPINLGPDGTLVSYPAPSDIDPSRLPIELGHGWLLDQRGVNEHTAFTRYTYAQYAALKEAPSPQQLLEAVIPGAKVTAMATLPMSISQAVADPQKAAEMLRQIEK